MTAPAAACAECGRQLDLGAAVCGACRSPVGQAQRRVVVVMFADLAGYTALCSARDPEDVHTLVRPLMNRLRAVCEQHGGVVPAIEGDGFMAVFGAVQSSETDPERALTAAADLQALVTEQLAEDTAFGGLHIGLHVGEVLVAPSWEACGYSFAGDAVNVARRLSGLAAAGEVVASGELVSVAPSGLVWGEQRAAELRGRPGIVMVRQLAWEVSGLPPTTGRWRTPWVARPDVEKRLTDALERGTVVVTGDAGMGKTRLVEHLDENGEALWLSSTDTRRLTWEDIADLLLERIVGQRTFLGHLTDDEAVPAVAAVLSRALADRPRMVVIDDAHWLAEEDLERVARLATQGVPSLRFAILTRDPHACLEGLPCLEVGSLAPDEIQSFTAALLPGPSEELQSFLTQRCGGVPLFLEQCSALLIEEGTVVLDGSTSRIAHPEQLSRVPTSMRLYVAGRLDQLAPGTRKVLETAAALGTTPDRDLLLHLEPEGLPAVEDLLTRGIFTASPAAAGEARTELRFTHALVRDVAYESTLKARRAFVHRAAAEWYAVLPVASVLESQAQHLEAAVSLGTSDCELVRSAIASMVTYARSIQAERPRTAAGVLTRADAIERRHQVCQVDRRLLDLTTAGTAVVLGDAPRAAELAAVAVAVFDHEPVLEAEAWLALGKAQALLRDDDAQRSFARAAEVFAGLGDTTRAALADVERATLVDTTDSIRVYLDAQERAYRSAIRTGDTRVQATAAQQLAVHAWCDGYSSLERWTRHAQDSSRADDVVLGPRLDLAAASVALYALDGATAVTRAERSLAAAQESGVSHVVANATMVSALGNLLVGNLADARRRLDPPREAVQGRREGMTSFHLGLVECRVLLREGQGDVATERLTVLSEHPLAQERSNRRDVDEIEAWLRLESGAFEKAAAAAGRGLAVDQAMGTPFPALQLRLVEVMAHCAARRPVPLHVGRSLIHDARTMSAGVIEGVASRFLALEEVLRGHGWQPEEHVPGAVTEIVALDAELQALSSGQADRLLEAAELWSGLGRTVWQARALLWHEELTGTQHADVTEILRSLASPQGLATQLRSQVTALRA